MSPRGPLLWDSVLSSHIMIFLLTCSVSLSSSLCFLDATDAVPLAATKPVTLDLVDAVFFFVMFHKLPRCVSCNSKFIQRVLPIPSYRGMNILWNIACT